MAEQVELPISGMTCASCANRIERNLNKLDGVEASVNYATEKASVSYDGDAVEPEALLAAVEAAGYTASLPADVDRGADEGAHDHMNHDDPGDRIGLRLVVAAILSAPLLAMSMILRVPPLVIR